MEKEYNYNDIQRAKRELLIKNFIFEMIEQYQYSLYKMSQDGNIMTIQEVQSMFEDKLSSINENDFDKFTLEIMELFLNKV